MVEAPTEGSLTYPYYLLALRLLSEWWLYDVSIQGHFQGKNNWVIYVFSLVMKAIEHRNGEKKPIVASYDMPEIQWTYSIIGPLVASYDMSGVQWVYSIPGTLAASYDMSGVQRAYSIPGTLAASYDMSGVQWTYSIPGTLAASYDMSGVQWTYSIPGTLAASYDMSGVQWTYSIPGTLKMKTLLSHGITQGRQRTCVMWFDGIIYNVIHLITTYNSIH